MISWSKPWPRNGSKVSTAGEPGLGDELVQQGFGGGHGGILSNLGLTPRRV